MPAGGGGYHYHWSPNLFKGKSKFGKFLTTKSMIIIPTNGGIWVSNRQDWWIHWSIPSYYIERQVQINNKFQKHIQDWATFWQEVNARTFYSECLRNERYKKCIICIICQQHYLNGTTRHKHATTHPLTTHIASFPDFPTFIYSHSK